MTKEIEVCDFRYDEGFRTRIEKQIMPTITTKGGGGISGIPMVKEIEIIGSKQKHASKRTDGICPTLTAAMGMGGGQTPMLNKKLRIRKLTPKECWRLMGFDDEDFEKAKQVNSDSQLYRQAGNSITVDVMEAIFREML